MSIVSEYRSLRPGVLRFCLLAGLTICSLYAVAQQPLPSLNPRDMAMTIPGDFVLASVGDLMMRRPASRLADDAVQAAHLPAVRKTAREVAGGVPSGGGAEPLNQLAVDIACLLINEDLPRSHQCYL